MSDNILVVNGAYSAIVGTKEIANVHYQKVAVVDSGGNIVSGGLLGATDTDDGQVSSGQSTVALTFQLPYIWDGSQWVRSSGYSTSRTIGAATTNATAVKGSPGVLYGWYATNTNSAPRYLKLYNKASAPVVGVDTPSHTLLLPGNSTGAGTAVEVRGGLAFSTGLGFGITTNPTDNDATAPNASEVVVHLFYR